MIYLDNSATTRPYDEVIKEVRNTLPDFYQNPAALYPAAIDVSHRVQGARLAVARLAGCSPKAVTFTSGGTESDNTVIFGAVEKNKRVGKTIITDAVEHPAVLEPIKKLEQSGYNVIRLGVDENCRINIEEFKEALSEDVILITIMSVNNEVGTVMPINDLATLTRNYFDKTGKNPPVVHTDAVQAFGKIDLRDSEADFMSVSAHKIHGLKGMGATINRRETSIPPYILGGGQESGNRSGTENTTGIIAFGKACEIAYEGFDERQKYVSSLRTHLKSGIESEIRNIRINTPETDTVPGILNVSFLGCRGEVILHELETHGICVSTGSACSSHKKGQSHVLKAMGLSNKEIEGAVRFSLSEFNTEAEIDVVVHQLKNAVNRFRKLGTFR